MGKIDRHAVLMMTYDQVQEQSALTVQALETVLAQDIGPLDVLLIDNGSTVPATWEHFQMVRDLYLDRKDETRIHAVRHRQNVAPVKVTNCALDYLWKLGHDKVLAVPNDIMIAPNTYRLMNEWPRGMVTPSMTSVVDFPRVTETRAISEETPMAMALVRKWFFDALVAMDGYYLDEGYFHYAADCDLSHRMLAYGLRGIKIDLPFWHQPSSSWRLLPSKDGKIITDQADLDREYFFRKWGYRVDDPAYWNAAADLNFKGQAKVAAQG